MATLKSSTNSGRSETGIPSPRSSRRPSLVESPTLTERPPLPPIPSSPGPVTVSGQRRRSSANVCRICGRENCQLKSHRQYANTLLKRQAQQRRASDSQQKRPGDEDADSPSPNSDGVDGLPGLPLDELDSKECRKLFHNFFHQVRRHMMLILFPPPTTTLQKSVMAKAQERSLLSATSNPVYCMNAVAAAYFDQVVRVRGFRREKFPSTIYGKLLQLLRQKLSDFEKTEIESLLTVVLTIVVFDIADGKTTTLAAHRAGMRQLVDTAGGCHNLGKMLPWVLSMDRTLSTHTGQPAFFCTRLSRAIQRPVRYPEKYGTFFSDAARVEGLDVDVVNYAHDVCRAFELLEGQKITFDPSTSCIAQSPDCHYFYFLRDRLGAEFVYLNTIYFELKDINKCILYTTRAVEYVVLSDNYIVTTSAFCATKVLEVLKDCDDLEETWDGNKDTLHWILVVLSVLPSPWDGSQWSRDTLRDILSVKYCKDEVWSPDWRDLELENLHKFVWSDTRLNRRFDKLCDYIEQPVDTDDTSASADES